MQNNGYSALYELVDIHLASIYSSTWSCLLLIIQLFFTQPNPMPAAGFRLFYYYYFFNFWWEQLIVSLTLSLTDQLLTAACTYWWRYWKTLSMDSINAFMSAPTLLCFTFVRGRTRQVARGYDRTWKFERIRQLCSFNWDYKSAPDISLTIAGLLHFIIYFRIFFSSNAFVR